MSEQTFLDELAINRGKIYAPDGKWLDCPDAIPAYYHGDIWCDPKEEIELPSYEQNMARFIETVAQAGLCGSSGTARFGFIYSHVTDRAKGELFDWNQVFIDHQIVPKFTNHVFLFCDFFGEAPRRTMNRLKERVNYPRGKLLQDRMFYRMAVLSLARKCALARMGYPEYCKRTVF